MATGLSLSVPPPIQSAGAAGSGGSSVTVNSTETNMPAESMAALNLLISQLMGGGTQQMAAQEALRLSEVNRQRANQAAYSKEAAFADAQGAMQAYLAEAIQRLMPTITRAAEAAGTSQNSMRALLAQDVAAQAAEGAAKVGLDASANYGQISANFANVLNSLTAPNNSVTEALLNALNIAKGSVRTASETRTGTGGSSSGSGSGSSSGSGGFGSGSNSIGQSAGSGNYVAPGGIALPGGNAYYGPTISDSQIVDLLSRNTSMAESGMISSLVNNNAWQGFVF